MKTILTIIFIATITAGFISCKKENSSSTIAGTWAVVSDSTSIAGNTTFKGGGQTYAGTANDHYIFTTDGHLYVKEGTTIDTAQYTVAGNQLNITYNYIFEGGATIKGAVGNYDINTLSDHSLILSKQGLTPEGAQVQIINLKR